MAAGMHQAGMGAVERRAVFFLNGQRIHVRPQRHQRPLIADMADDAGAGDPRFRLDAQIVQCCMDQLGRFQFIEA
jgi:hypothetical protein